MWRKFCEKLALEIADEVTISPALFRAFCEVNRAEFVSINSHAFSLEAQPLPANQWISSPLTVAKMTMALELDGVDKVLEVGCGSGYQAAILSKIVRRVFAIERIRTLADIAKKHFENLNISNIHLRYDDGNSGWKNYAPYERILLSAATKKVDDRLFSQLEVGGVLVAPIENENSQNITKFIKKSENDIQKVVLDSCEFVPLLKGIQ